MDNIKNIDGVELENINNRLMYVITALNLSASEQIVNYGNVLNTKLACRIYDIPPMLFFKVQYPVSGAKTLKKAIDDAIVEYMQEVLDGQY